MLAEPSATTDNNNLVNSQEHKEQSFFDESTKLSQQQIEQQDNTTEQNDISKDNYIPTEDTQPIEHTVIVVNEECNDNKVIVDINKYPSSELLDCIIISPTQSKDEDEESLWSDEPEESKPKQDDIIAAKTNEHSKISSTSTIIDTITSPAPATTPSSSSPPAPPPRSTVPLMQLPVDTRPYRKFIHAAPRPNNICYTILDWFETQWWAF
eukprot:UN02792